MTSSQFIAFLERKLAEHGVKKPVPEEYGVLEQHARRVITRALPNKRLDAIRGEVDVEAATVALPDDLRQQIEATLEAKPAIPRDLAVARIARSMTNGEAA
jgi:hypothetical protein